MILPQKVALPAWAGIPCAHNLPRLQDSRFAGFIRKPWDSAVHWRTEAFTESLVQLHCTMATVSKPTETSKLPDPCNGWWPITRGFGEVPVRPLPRASGWKL